jgi:hypothetical protein
MTITMSPYVLWYCRKDKNYAIHYSIYPYGYLWTLIVET